MFPLRLITSVLEHKLRPTDGRQVEELVSDVYFLTGPDVFGLGAFLEMVGILEGLAPPGLRGVSEVSEQTERASCSSEASEASLPRRLLALLPARLPARLAGPLTADPPRFGSSKRTKTLKTFQSQKLSVCVTNCAISPVRDGLLPGVVPPFSPVSEPRLEWSAGLFSLDPDAAPCRTT